ncbi:MAG: multicopper oxidase domain-containing protein [Kineosporiaceae bacterium]|jgi:FtsP/CotA-like multicopper oxidase with cupredoxin domain
MRVTRLLRASRTAVLAAVVGAVVALFGAVPTPATAASEGAECLTGSGSTPTFTLTATSGYIQTPDGNTIYTWGYAGPAGTFQLPGPTLCVDEGDTVTVVLQNKLKYATSVVFPGQTGVTADGAPATPTFSTGTAGGSLVQPVAGRPTTTSPIPSVTYTFTAGAPGTYLYESGTDQRLQVQMGLYGALVVRPAGHPDRVYADASTTFKGGQEYVHLLSEVDPVVHAAVERNRVSTIVWANYKPRYFLLNGRSMPDTIAPNHAPYLPAQPYGSTVHIQPRTSDNPLPAVIRYLNAGIATYPFHPHGNSQRVVGRDGRALAGTTGEDLTYDKFLVDVGPGQTVDTLLSWTDVEMFNPTDNPIGVPLPSQQNLDISADTWWSQSPYLGVTSDLPPGVTSYNTCGEYYHVAHSHALQQSTNFGAAFGGMMTLIRIDPPDATTC